MTRKEQAIVENLTAMMRQALSKGNDSLYTRLEAMRRRIYEKQSVLTQVRGL